MPLTAAMSEGFHDASRAVSVDPVHFFVKEGAHLAAAERGDQAVQYEGSDELPDHGCVIIPRPLRSGRAKDPIREWPAPARLTTVTLRRAAPNSFTSSRCMILSPCVADGASAMPVE